MVRVGIPRRPVLVHGAALETLDVALRSGVMPPSRVRLCRGWFSFVPIADYLPEDIAEEVSADDVGDALEHAAFYARMSAVERYLLTSFGSLPEWYADVGCEEWDNFSAWMREVPPYGLSPVKIEGLLERLNERKGVLVFPKKSVLEFVRPSRFRDSVRVYAPKGFPVSMIASVFPLDAIGAEYLRRK